MDNFSNSHAVEVEAKDSIYETPSIMFVCLKEENEICVYDGKNEISSRFFR